MIHWRGTPPILHIERGFLIIHPKTTICIQYSVVLESVNKKTKQNKKHSDEQGYLSYHGLGDDECLTKSLLNKLKTLASWCLLDTKGSNKRTLCCQDILTILYKSVSQPYSFKCYSRCFWEARCQFFEVFNLNIWGKTDMSLYHITKNTKS